MSSSPKAPPAPDYTGAAQATAQGNLDAIKYQTEANRVNQYTPYGSSTWSKDPYGRWTQTETLSPELAAALQSQMNVQQGRSALADRMLGAVANSYGFTSPSSGGSSQSGGKSGSAPAPSGPTTAPVTGGAVQGASSTPASSGSLKSSSSTAPSASGGSTSGGGSTGGKSAGSSAPTTPVQQEYAADQGFGGQYQAFDAPQLAEYLKKVNSVSQNSVGQSGQFNSSAPALNTSQAQFTPTGVNAVNQNAPQFNQDNASLYAQKAYEAQMALLRPDLDRQQQALQNGLALQGLAPGTEANTNAQSAYSMARAAQENALAASSYLSGANTAQSNYAAQLAGFNAGNAAQNQAFGQAGSAFDRNLNAVAQANAARSQQFGQDLAGYGANLEGLNTNARLQAAQNAAQQQAYQQALNNYGMDYQSAITARNQPLNEMNALLSGQQIQNPQFNSFALQGQAQGADLLGAATAQGQWNQGIYNQQASAAAANNSALAGLAGTAAMAFAMY